MPNAATELKAIYWHRELPPLNAEPIGEHVIEASSARLADTILQREELWNRCEREVMANVHVRLCQEIARLGGRCARVVSESIEPQHNPSTGEVWLRGRFTYVLYR